jgi:hypothetical protein
VTAQTTAQRQEALRARRALLGLIEVRGIYAHPDDHPAIKSAAEKLRRKRIKDKEQSK